MKRWHKSFLISIVILIFIVSAFAQKGTSIVTRIKFARGRTTTIERGSVHRGMSHDYLLKAGAGQTMSVHLAAQGAVLFRPLHSRSRGLAGSMFEGLVWGLAAIG